MPGTQLHLRAAAVCLAAVAALTAGLAHAESTYGYAASGAGSVTATARVNLSVTVAKLILLRVGSANNTVDTATWTVGATIPAGAAVPVNSSNQPVNWNGAAPTIAPTAAPGAFNVYAWTNATTPTITCSMGAWSQAGGPTNADFTVNVTGSLPHPGANLGACGSTAFAGNGLRSGTWQYVLGGTPANWLAGTYTNTITYTAQGL